MKKHLLSLAGAVVMAAASAFAITPQRAPFVTDGEATVPAAAATDGYEIGFCGNPGTAYTLGVNNVTTRCYIYITPEVATQLAGNKLTEISLSPALLLSKNLDGYIFVSEDINGEPVSKTDVTFTNSYNTATKKQTFQTHTLTDAYEIKENTGFYFGYVMNKVRSGSNSADYVVGVDNDTPNSFAGYAEVISNGEVTEKLSVGDTFGHNLLLKAKTVGEKIDITNLLDITSVSFGNYTLNIPVELSGYKATVRVYNLGSNRIKSINYTVSVEGGESVTADRVVSILGNRSGLIGSIALPDLTTGHRGKVTFTINKVNDVDITPVSGSTDYIGVEGDGYPRKFLVEEATGTWCGWCPRGIVAFDYMSVSYPEDFIGIAVHSGDIMETASYEPIFRYLSSFPSCIVNRDPKSIITDLSSATLKASYTKWQSQKGAAKVEVETNAPADGKLNVTATTTFAIDDPQADYSLAFVTLEDGIIASQQNYFAGGGSGQMGGWENKGSTVRTEYKHVARNIYEYNGVQGSIPAQVTKGEPVVFNYDVPLDNVSNVDKSSVVVLLLDNETGTILNAAQIHADQYGHSGISDITTDAAVDAPVEYYNLQGIRMSGDNLPAGVYITRQGGKTAKVLVK